MPDYLTGDELEENDKAVADEMIEDCKAEQKLWSEGAIGLPGHKRNSASRYAFYMSVTLPTEMDLVLDPDYREKVAMGIYPPLADVLWYVIDPQTMAPLTGPLPSQDVAMTEAAAMGLLRPEMLPGPMGEPPMMPPPVGSKPNYWTMMLDLGEFPDGWSMFKVKSKDFMRVIEAAGKRLEVEV